jgi:gliding motility-associated-like protein
MNEVEISWNIPDSACADDAGSYNVYYSPTGSDPFILLATISDISLNHYTYTNEISIAGCFYVTAVDTNGNEGPPGEKVCFDNCPFYELPNVFTPDGNGKNDLFHPFPYRYVKDIDLKIYNRWGMVVFETRDPDVNWNGKTDNTGEELPSGVYFYTCIVNEIYLGGIKPRKLREGTVQLLRGDSSPSE